MLSSATSSWFEYKKTVNHAHITADWSEAEALCGVEGVGASERPVVNHTICTIYQMLKNIYCKTNRSGRPCLFDTKSTFY